MSEKEHKLDEYEKISLKETFKIGVWSFSLFYRNRPGPTVTLLVTSVLTQISAIVYTYIFARIIDSIINIISQETPDFNQLYPNLIILLVFNIFDYFVKFIRERAGTIINNACWTFQRIELYTRLKDLGIQTLEMPNISNRVTRANEYFYQIRWFFDNVIGIVATFIKLVLATFIIVSYLPNIAFLITLVTIPYVFIDTHYRKKSSKHDYENTELNRRLEFIAWNLAEPEELKEILTTSSFKFLDGIYKKFKKRLEEMQLSIDLSWTNWEYLFLLLRSFIILFGYVKTIQRAVLKIISVGDVTFLLRSIDVFESSLNTFASDISGLREQAVRIRDSYSLFVTEPEYPSGSIIIPSLNIGPDIDFSNVSFRYPSGEVDVIKDLNLHIKSGEKIAIVGPNGAGKTTLVKLLSRFYPPSKGDLKINNINIVDVDSKSLYKNLAILFQDFNRYFYLSVKENICIGSPDEKQDETRMRLAAQAADALEFINEYPDKFEQVLSERFKGGIKPSVGQWQKIALARFFYRDAPLVIFDEPTAAIDAISEYKIFSKIYEFFEGKTVIIISHRYSTVRNADRIIVLEKGQIVEEGTHEHLMSLDGKYAEGFRLQAEGYTN